MKINILTVGHRLPQWINDGFQTYANQLQPVCQLQLVKLPTTILTIDHE